MSAIYTDYAVQQLMLEMKDASGTIPTQYYLGMFTTTPIMAGTGGVEVPTTGGTSWYGRIAITLGSPSGRTQANTNTIQFSPAVPSGGAVATPIVSVGVFDQITGGNLWIIVPTTTPITIGVGSQVIMPIGQLVFTFAAT